MFPTAHYGNPGSYAGFTSADCRKEPFFRKGQKHGRRPDKSDRPAMLLPIRYISKKYLKVQNEEYYK